MSDPAFPPPPYPPPPPAFPPPPPPASRRVLPVVVAIVLALLLVTAAVAVPLVLGDDTEEVASDGAVDLSAVREYDDLEVAHTPADIDYPQSPPVGGPHAPVWLDCGVYDEPVRDENAVHDLEHGTVWITYDPDLDADDVATLAGLLPQNGVLSPYDGLDSPVVVTVWGRQLDLSGADDPRLSLFIDTFGGGETAPEPFASCAGGVRDPDGGTGTSV
ncbi:DUF3105 domain-containing protein [Nocardioides sp. PD653-B2]|uniref:DUF3105 domain-containing protein n=1 Tax=Nocardioides sp. PD653-B2 TaxID=1892811 RepID=UPI000A26E24A|nr:DUF3105 domain-containing protein [Nocardioides sp. PD653-B2]